MLFRSEQLVVEAGEYEMNCILNNNTNYELTYNRFTPLGEIIKNPDSLFVLEKKFPRISQLQEERHCLSLSDMVKYYPDTLTEDVLSEVDMLLRNV